jgi:hypothetical protein
MLWFKFAHQRLFKLGPVVGQAGAQANASLCQRDAGLQTRANGLARNDIAVNEALQSRLQRLELHAEIISDARFGSAMLSQSEQDGIVSRLKAFFIKRNNQGLVSKLASFNELIERRTGGRFGHKRENKPNSFFGRCTLHSIVNREPTKGCYCSPTADEWDLTPELMERLP